jgi:hypothetical protein
MVGSPIGRFGSMGGAVGYLEAGCGSLPASERRSRRTKKQNEEAEQATEQEQRRMGQPKTAAIVLGFAAVIAGLVWLGFSLEERYVSKRAELQEARVEREPAREESPSAREPIQWPSQLPSPLWLGWGAALAGWVWTLFAALEAGTGWFFAVLFGNWLGGLIFSIARPDLALKPVALWTAGYLLMLYSGFFAS